MPETLDRPPGAALSTLPGASILRRTRSLLVCALGTGFVYSMLSVASKGGCPGGATGDGGFLDADGQATDVAPNCITVTLQPSTIVYLAIAVIVLVAISRVLRTAASEAAALRTLDRAAIMLVAVTATWLVITQVSFWLIPLDQWDGGEFFPIPFTFGTIDVDISPMQQG
ncbi:hypothetical protein ASE14_15650 [Agromyces sp. Root81]|uniref:hypothetical protein n=1 Tax=Agromyces sp. Root81 TaxID=1736601 RepID=UPI000701540E|nr:hypothetical protein [Agromyces sp. Root81]KRC59203.1 hypothetical protein ASE14_15650 [Agromyces sp. Root81]